METTTYEPHLVQAGLSPEQARIYESLVERGPSLASDAARRAGISRTLGYKVLGELSLLGLVEKKDEPGKVALFIAAHPLKLKEIVERREREAKDARTVVDSIVGGLSSAYNLAGGKPGVEFFEGLKGIRHVIFDTLQSKDTLRSYADIEAIGKYARDLNTEYVAERNRRKISKKMIVLDTPGSRAYFGNRFPDVTDIRLIKADEQPFHSVMHIYDNKVSYLTLSEERLMGIIITDAHIALTHRYLFDFTWAHAESIQDAFANSKTA